MALSYGTQDFRTLIEKLSNMEKKASKDISEKVLKEGANEVLDDMKRSVPVDTGHLKKSLEVYGMSGRGSSANIKVGINPSRRDELRYGFYQEYGHSRMVGTHWLSQSWDTGKIKADKKIKEGIVRELTGK